MKLDDVFDLVSSRDPIPYGLVNSCDLDVSQKERLIQFIKSRGYEANGTAYIGKG